MNRRWFVLGCVGAPLAAKAAADVVLKAPEPRPVIRAGRLGDIIYSTDPARDGAVCWVCVAPGSPEAWKPVGIIPR